MFNYNIVFKNVRIIFVINNNNINKNVFSSTKNCKLFISESIGIYPNLGFEFLHSAKSF